MARCMIFKTPRSTLLGALRPCSPCRGVTMYTSVRTGELYCSSFCLGEGDRSEVAYNWAMDTGNNKGAEFSECSAPLIPPYNWSPI